MIYRDPDAAFLNSVANHPDVRRWLGAGPDGSLTSAIDFQPLLDGGALALVEKECGGFLVIDLGHGAWECHTMFLPDKRGLKAYYAACAALDYMFHQTDCTHLLTQLPDGNFAAKGLARRVGFMRIPDRSSLWRDAGGKGEDWALEKTAWLQGRATG